MPHTIVLKCDPRTITFLPSSETPEISCPDTREALRIASHHLLDLHRPVAFPTETVYGLGASALNASAASQIFSVKGRPPDNPLIVHVSSSAMLHSLLPKNCKLSTAYQILMKRFWPGALTLLFPCDRDVIPSIVTAHHPTVAIRMPAHPVARALIAISKTPIAAPSANLSGKPSPTRAEHVLRDLGGKIDLILDGGSCMVGLESTVVDGLNEDGNIRVLRPGGVTVEDIEMALQEATQDGSPVPRVLVHQRDYCDQTMEIAPPTPGMKYRHYSPSVPVVLLFTLSPPPPGTMVTPVDSFLMALHNGIPNAPNPLRVGLLVTANSQFARNTSPDEGIQWFRYELGPASEPWTIAQHLFDGLLTLECEGVDIIIAEEVPEAKEGLAVMNRLKKAASKFVWVEYH